MKSKNHSPPSLLVGGSIFNTSAQAQTMFGNIASLKSKMKDQFAQHLVRFILDFN